MLGTLAIILFSMTGVDDLIYALDNPSFSIRSSAMKKLDKVPAIAIPIFYQRACSIANTNSFSLISDKNDLVMPSKEQFCAMRVFYSPYGGFVEQEATPELYIFLYNNEVYIELSNLVHEFYRTEVGGYPRMLWLSQVFRDEYSIKEIIKEVNKIRAYKYGFSYLENKYWPNGNSLVVPIPVPDELLLKERY